MIKAVIIVRETKNAAEFAALSSLFQSLGFEAGTPWDDPEDPVSGREASRGAPCLAPLGCIEFVEGKAAIEGDLLVEVTDLDAVHKRVGGSSLGRTSEVKATHWKSRYFTYQATGHISVTFWQYDHPSRYAHRCIEGELVSAGSRFGIVVSRFNSFITERLLQGALDALHRTGTRDSGIEIVRVPGAFEVPIAARKLSETRQVDAVICLGLLLRGETSNYEQISQEVTRGIGQAAQETGVPCTYGVLTCDTLDQAIDRAGLKMGNKGFEAAMSAVEMVSLQKKLKRKRSRKAKAVYVEKE